MDLYRRPKGENRHRPAEKNSRNFPIKFGGGIFIMWRVGGRRRKFEIVILLPRLDGVRYTQKKKPTRKGNSVKKSLQGRISFLFFHLIFYFVSMFRFFHSHHLLMFARTRLLFLLPWLPALLCRRCSVFFLLFL
jgi:hypothetical protein